MHYSRLLTIPAIKLAGTTIGSLLLGCSIAPAAFAQYYPLLNPCPGIYYEEPFNSTRTVPAGCPPNAATQFAQTRSQSYRVVPNRTAPFERSAPLQPPLPESRADAVTNVALVNNSFDVMVRNNTNAIVSYEVIGQTQRRYLQGGAGVMLQGVSAPATITFVRQDNGDRGSASRF